MHRRGLITISIAGLLSVAVLGGLQSTRQSATASVMIDDPAAEARTDFSTLLNTQQPDVSAVGNSVFATAENFSDIPFPHVAMYGSTNSSGWPFVGSWDTITNVGGLAINQEAISDYNRFPLMLLPATPLVDARPDIVTALRANNPNNKIIAYLMGHTIWCAPDGSGNNSYPTDYYYRHYWLAATDGDAQCTTSSNGLLWMQGGLRADAEPHNLGINVNLAKREGNGSGGYVYTVAESLAGTMFADVYQKGTLDGIFIDVFCSGIAWMEDSDSKFDYVRSGYTDGIADNGDDNLKPAVAAAFHAGWTEGHRVLGETLRGLIDAAGGTNYPISANCGQGPTTLYEEFNGWMRENYPFQNGGTWYANSYRRPGGYFFEDRAFRAPQLNYIFTAAAPSTAPYSASNQRKMRFGLAATTLGNGWFSFEDSIGAPSAPPPPNIPYPKWWYDEYGVDRRTGLATTGTNRGWLGQPISPAYQQFTETLNSDLVTSATMDAGVGVWPLSVGAPAAAVVTTDTSSKAEGAASSKITITAVNAADYGIRLSSPGFTMTANTEYAVTFWAKADVDRPISVALDKPGGGGYAHQYLPISTNWQRYQIRLKPTTSMTGAQVWLSVGEQTGSVWFDDVHLQVGLTSLFRRDFTYGSVLLNPADNAVTVPLEKPYKKILGSVTPVVNDGSIVSTITLAGANSAGGTGDAIFLLDVDVTSPGTTNDLRAP